MTKTDTRRPAPSRASKFRAAIARQAAVIAKMNARPSGAVPRRSPLARAAELGDALTRDDLVNRLGVLAGLAKKGAR